MLQLKLLGMVFLIFILYGIIINILRKWVAPWCRFKLQRIDARVARWLDRRRTGKFETQLKKLLTQYPDYWMGIRFTGYDPERDILFGLVYVCRHTEPYKFEVLEPTDRQIIQLHGLHDWDLIMGIQVEKREIIRRRIRSILRYRINYTGVKTGADILSGPLEY